MFWMHHALKRELARKQAAAKLAADFEAAVEQAETAAAAGNHAPETAGDRQAAPPTVDTPKRRR